MCSLCINLATLCANVLFSAMFDYSETQYGLEEVKVTKHASRKVPSDGSLTPDSNEEETSDRHARKNVRRYRGSASASSVSPHRGHAHKHDVGKPKANTTNGYGTTKNSELSNGKAKTYGGTSSKEKYKLGGGYSYQGQGNENEGYQRDDNDDHIEHGQSQEHGSGHNHDHGAKGHDHHDHDHDHDDCKFLYGCNHPNR